MNFTTPKSSTAKSTMLMFVGLALGAMTSRAAMGLIHEDKAGLSDADAKKQTYMKLGKRTAIAGASGYAAAGLQGKDDMSIILKNVALGAASIQIIDGVKDASGNSAKITALTTGTKTQKAMAKALGLGCPCENNNVTLEAMPLNAPRRRRSLRGPGLVVDNYGTPGTPIFNQNGNSPFQQALNKGASLQ